MATERLQKIIAAAGVASRRKAEELISTGRVAVNGQTVTELGTKADPERDHIRVNGKLLRGPERPVYLLLNKPKGFVTTVSDPEGRPTVMNLLAGVKGRVYPVGRLDSDTSGLLLLTNDGDFALRLTHPRYSTEKHYQALVQGCPTEAALEALRRGVDITEDDGRVHRTAPAQVRVLRRAGTNCWLTLTLHEGRKRQVRRMLATAGHPVLQLVRVGIGPLMLGDLAVGKWRYLTDEEVKALL